MCIHIDFYYKGVVLTKKELNLLLSKAYVWVWASQVALAVKNPPANAGDMRDVGSIPGSSGRSPGEGKGYPLQYSCLGNPMDRGAWQPQSTRSQRVGHD